MAFPTDRLSMRCYDSIVEFFIECLISMLNPLISLFRKQWVIFLIFLVGIGLRGVALDRYSFLFDQVQIAENADRIRHGNLTLIGPRTGPADMFTGPLIYYMTALVSVMVPSPYSVAITSLGIFVLSFIFLAWVMLRQFEKTHVTIFLSLYSISTFQVALDRIPWNPNLSFLAGALTFFPLFKMSKREELDIWDNITLALGLFLGFQAHFSGLLLPAIAILCWVLWSRKLKTLIFIGLGTIVTLVPMFVFDVKNNWLNLRGFIELLSSEKKEKVGILAYVGRFIKDLSTVVSSTGRFFLYEPPIGQQFVVGMLFTFGYLYTNFKIKTKRTWFPIIWCLLFLGALVFYRGAKPEYYFLMVFPALLLFVANVLNGWLSTNKSRLVATGFFLFLSIVTLHRNISAHQGMVIGDELAAVAYTKELLTQQDYSLVYDVPRDQDVGLKYLLAGIPEKNTPIKIHFIFPVSDADPVTKKFGSLAVWVDPRIYPDSLYIQRGKLTIVTPKTLRLLQDVYPRNTFTVAEVKYALFNHDKNVGNLYLIDDRVEKDFSLQTFLESIAPPVDVSIDSWQKVAAEGKSVFMKKMSSKYFLFESTLSLPDSEIIEFLDKIGTIYP